MTLLFGFDSVSPECPHYIIFFAISRVCHLWSSTLVFKKRSREKDWALDLKMKLIILSIIKIEGSQSDCGSCVQWSIYCSEFNKDQCYLWWLKTWLLFWCVLICHISCTGCCCVASQVKWWTGFFTELLTLLTLLFWNSQNTVELKIWKSCTRLK